MLATVPASRGMKMQKNIKTQGSSPGTGANMRVRIAFVLINTLGTVPKATEVCSKILMI